MKARINRIALIGTGAVVLVIVALVFTSRNNSGAALPEIDQHLFSTRDEALIGANAIGAVSEIDLGNMVYQGAETVGGVTVGSAQFLQAPGQPVLWYVIEVETAVEDASGRAESNSISEAGETAKGILTSPNLWFAVLILMAYPIFRTAVKIPVPFLRPKTFTIEFKKMTTLDQALEDFEVEVQYFRDPRQEAAALWVSEEHVKEQWGPAIFDIINAQVEVSKFDDVKQVFRSTANEITTEDLPEVGARLFKIRSGGMEWSQSQQEARSAAWELEKEAEAYQHFKRKTGMANPQAVEYIKNQKMTEVLGEAAEALANAISGILGGGR